MILSIITLSVATLAATFPVGSARPIVLSPHLALGRRQSEKLGLFDIGTAMEIIADFAYIQAYGTPESASDPTIESNDQRVSAYADTEALGNDDAECNADPELCLEMTDMVADVADDGSDSLTSIFE